MAKESRKLPRGPHAAKPGADEVQLKKGGADLQNGWLSRHGDLVATEDRLVFLPTVLDTILGAKRREISLDDITEVERYPKSPDAAPTAGRRPRMLIHTSGCVYEFMVGDMDSWIDSLERIYAIRAKKGRGVAPAITREGYTNLLLVED